MNQLDAPIQRSPKYGDLRPSRRLLARVAIAALSIGIGLPTVQILGRSPTFFLARDLRGVEIALAALLLLALPPVVAGIAALIPARIGRILLRLSSAIGVGALLLAPFGSIGQVGLGLAVTALAPIIGLMLVDHLPRAGWFQDLASVLAYTPVVLLLLFSVSETGGLIWSDRESIPLVDGRVRIPAPVVVVVFDEYPSSVLIGEDGQLRDWYPAMQEFSDDAIWFRNAVTVDSVTDLAVPALLTGRVPGSTPAIPNSANHPESLFARLSGTHGLRSLEPITRLCDWSACERLGERRTAVDRARGTAIDVTMVALHAILPASTDGFLPSIDRTWGQFAFQDELASDRRREVEIMKEQLGTAPSPAFTFLHLMLPHTPYQYAPDGSMIFAEPLQVESVRTPAEADLSLQRLLLQAGFADRVLGEVVGRLKELGVYEESLVVVTADHGIVFRSGLEPRGLTQETVGDIGYVPLFVKLPGNVMGGTVDDYPAELIDVLPTIGGVLGASGWEADGIDLLAADRPDPASRQVISGVGFRRDFDQVLATVGRIDGLFPDGDRYTMVPAGVVRVIGELVEDGPVLSGVSWGIEDEGHYAAVDPGSGFVPLFVRGWLEGPIDVGSQLAVVVNGRVAAQTLVQADAGRLRFYATIPPSSLVAGSNTIGLATVSKTGSLVRISEA